MRPGLMIEFGSNCCLTRRIRSSPWPLTRSPQISMRRLDAQRTALHRQVSACIKGGFPDSVYQAFSHVVSLVIKPVEADGPGRRVYGHASFRQLIDGPEQASYPGWPDGGPEHEVRRNGVGPSQVGQPAPDVGAFVSPQHGRIGGKHAQRVPLSALDHALAALSSQPGGILRAAEETGRAFPACQPPAC